MAAGGGIHKSEGAKSGSMLSPNPIFPVNARKEAGPAVGVGEQSAGGIEQVTKNAPQVPKDAPENKKLSVSRGWRILKAE